MPDGVGHYEGHDGAGVLAALRQRAGQTQSELAQKAQVSRSMVAQLEMGERRPSRKLLARIGEALRLSEEDTHRLYVAYGFTPEGDTPEQIAAFLRADKRLTSHQAERLALLVRRAYERALQEAGLEEDSSNRPNLDLR